MDMYDHNSHVCPYECAHGRNERDLSVSRTKSFGFSTILRLAPLMLEVKFKWVSSTPFGFPVVPDVLFLLLLSCYEVDVQKKNVSRQEEQIGKKAIPR